MTYLAPSYYRARYYDPQTGRFISEDPLGFAGGIDFYAYTHNHPIDFLDPFGLADVYIWNGDGSAAAALSGGAWGHAAIRLDDGTYISWWPDPARGTEQKEGRYTRADAIRDDTYAHDVKDEKRPPDQVIHIDGLDEARIADWWKKYKKNPIWDFSKRNCSHTVVDAISAGIPPGYHATPPKPWVTTSPSDAAGYANAVKKLLQSPAPGSLGGGGGNAW